MGYIMDLRAVVGHRPLIMTCAGVLVLNEYNQLLLQKRADNGLWGYPGGSMELGESFEECAARELREETGLVAKELVHYMNISGDAVHYFYPNGDEIYAAEEIFLCRAYDGVLQRQESEVFELKFFNLDGLPSREEINPNNFLPVERIAGEHWKAGL